MSILERLEEFLLKLESSDAVFLEKLDKDFREWKNNKVDDKEHESIELEVNE